MITVTSAASSHRLTTLAVVKQALGLTDTTSDDLLGRLIDAASAAINRITERVFAREGVTETIAGSGRLELVLDRVPIISLSELRLNGEAVGDVEVLDRDAGLVFYAAGFDRAEVSSRGGIAGWPTGARPTWEVDYVGGYWLPSFSGSPGAEDLLLPADVEQAAVETVRAWYAAVRDGASSAHAADVVSERLGDWAVTYGGVGAGGATMLPDAVRADLVRNWKRPKI